MGNKKNKQLVVLSLTLLIIIILVYQSPDSVAVNKPYGLKTALGPISGYTLLRAIPLDQDIYAFLELDDFTQTDYVKDGSLVNLYIGYYNSLDKVSAAHSPTVCFPGQGWQIDQPIEKSVNFDSQTINYAEIVADLEDHHSLVLYWYQAGSKSTPEVYANKMNAVLNKILRQKEEHAFVRVSVPFDGKDRDKARKIGIDFIEEFYPIFLDYVESTP